MIIKKKTKPINTNKAMLRGKIIDTLLNKKNQNTGIEFLTLKTRENVTN